MVNLSKIIEQQRALGKNTSGERITLSAEGKRQAIIEKVAEDIVDRITRFGPQDEVDHEILNRLEVEIGQKIDFDKEEKSKFIFNTIGEDNKKSTNTFSTEDSGFLLKRLEQLVKEAVDKNMET